MPTSQTRSQAVRQSLRIRIESSSSATSTIFLTSHNPPSPAMAIKPQLEKSSDSESPNPCLFSVLCMYDFSSDDPALLSFNRSEILDIVKLDDTGWWAAMRLEGSKIGWIPQGYVSSPLSKPMAGRLRAIREELRIYEYDAEQLCNLASVTHSQSPLELHSSTTDNTKEGVKVSSSSSASYIKTSFRTGEECHAIRRRNTNPHLNSNFPQSTRSYPRPSHPSPIPQPPTRSASTSNKPWPPLPNQDPEIRLRAGSLTNIRSLRRRPVILDDPPTLSRLTNLIELKNSKEIDKIASPNGPSSCAPDTPKRSREEKPQRGRTIQDNKPIQTIVISRSAANMPWYLCAQFSHELDEDQKGNVRSGSLVALVEKLTTDVGIHDLTKLAESRTFTNVFLMTFRTFTTADRLFEMLVDRFYIKPSKALTETEYKDWKAKLCVPVQHHVLDVFSSWLEEHRLLEEEPHIAQRLTDFLNLIISPPHNTEATTIMQTLERLTFTVPVGRSTVASSKKARKSKAHKNDLFKLDPVDVAEHLALLEFSLYVKVTPQECLAYAKIQAGNAVARLVDFCKTHDRLVSWVTRSILNTEAQSKRADAIDFWIKVAEKCRLLNNFASMSAIIIALSSTVITRLHMTWVHVGRQTQLEALLRHNEPTGGFAGYRALLQRAEGPCVPFIGMFLTDIVHIAEQPNQQEGRINFFQRARWYEVITTMLRFQSCRYDLPTDESTMTFIENHLRESANWNQDWFWAQSEAVQRCELNQADIRKGLEAVGF